MKSFLLLTIVAISLWPQVNGQADGNPHVSFMNKSQVLYLCLSLDFKGWDRKRRCDADYEEPCGVCEGYGGIATGDRNDDITLTTCEPVGSADEVTPGPRPVWGTRWHLPVAYEVLIGKKMDPFCFQTFPGNDSVRFPIIAKDCNLKNHLSRLVTSAIGIKRGPKTMICSTPELSGKIWT